MWTPLILAVIVNLSAAEMLDINKYRQLLLTIHNDYRRKEPAANMMELVWDKAAERAATSWAKKCNFEHEMKGWGENLAFDAMPSNPTIESKIKSAMKAWHDEKNMFSYGQFSCGSSCHYTQLIWHSTTKVGCAINKCKPLYAWGQGINNAYYLVCYYKEGGNMMGENPYERGPKCSKCPSGSQCNQGLCQKPVYRPPSYRYYGYQNYRQKYPWRG